MRDDDAGDAHQRREAEVEDGGDEVRVGASRNDQLGDDAQCAHGDAGDAVAAHDGADEARVELPREAVDAALHDRIGQAEDADERDADRRRLEEGQRRHDHQEDAQPDLDALEEVPQVAAGGSTRVRAARDGGIEGEEGRWGASPPLHDEDEAEQVGAHVGDAEGELDPRVAVLLREEPHGRDHCDTIIHAYQCERPSPLTRFGASARHTAAFARSGAGQTHRRSRGKGSPPPTGGS